MKVIETALPGALIIEPQVFGDARGFFYESYNKAKWQEAGIDADFDCGHRVTAPCDTANRGGAAGSELRAIER